MLSISTAVRSTVRNVNQRPSIKVETGGATHQRKLKTTTHADQTAAKRTAMRNAFRTKRFKPDPSAGMGLEPCARSIRPGFILRERKSWIFILNGFRERHDDFDNGL